MSTINQKDYLKKYLGIGKAPGEKKKKKKEKIIGNKLKIIDDDADALISQEIQDDISAANEDAPQIVAVIDERPPSLRIDEQTKSNLWTPIGESSNAISNNHSLKLSSSFKLSKTKSSGLGSDRRHGIYDSKNNTKVKIEQEFNISSIRNGSDYSSPRGYIKSNKNLPPREIEGNSRYKRNNSPEDRSTLKKSRIDGKKGDENYDSSPPRRRNRKDVISLALNEESQFESNSQRIKQERDYSPMSRINRKDSFSSEEGNTEYDNFPLRRKNSGECGDYSPVRRKNKEDISPLPNKVRDEDDNSPPRRKRGDTFSSRERNKEGKSPPRRKYVEDNSPPRRKYIENNSPRCKSKADDIYSPSEKDKMGIDSSPLRRTKCDEDISPPRKRTEEIDNSPPRRSKRGDDKQKKSRWGQWSPEASPERPENSDDKLRKTLDGKKAGLQDAKDLVKETALLRFREDEMFKKLSAEVSGMNAATVVRRKEVRDLEEEARQRDNEKKTKEKYDRWGKGLKQVEDQNERIAEQLHEMSKPLARYADDEDLERYLKEQERDGDPMLAYIRRKKKKKAAVAGISEKPVYLGEFMPNRFGIRPGYRWDGVDRSNGYETKWFQVQNSKRATQEEAFKWSTEDM